MFIKYLDYLSPRVTFYYQGNLSHTSIISGIISIVAIVFLIILSVYFSLDIIQKSNPNTFFFNSFIEDSGTYYFNKTSLFHFVNIIQNIRGNEIHEDFDFTTFNIIGAQAHIDNFINNDKRGGLKTFDHWVYGNCNKNNTEGLDDLIKFDFFEKSACVIKYFNCTEGKYYSIDEPNFAWPRIAHGTFNDLNKLYGLYVQKCSDDILYQILGDGYNCKNDSEIDYYFDSLKGGRIMHFYFVNNYINILDYYNPINKFIYRMETPLYKEQYSTNSININPVLVRTHNGLILDNIKDDVTYMLDRNDVYISERKGANMYMAYCFFLKNNKEYYERTYKRIQEVISSIGGINQAILLLLFI